MKKSETLARWRSLPDRQDPLPLMEFIPYKAQGSRYGACGIRIDGTPEFIDAVLSNLKTLLAGENCITRLELARSQVKSTGDRHFANTADRAECCYVRLHQRGNEGVHAAAYDRNLVAATRLAFPGALEDA